MKSNIRLTLASTIINCEFQLKYQEFQAEHFWKRALLSLFLRIFNRTVCDMFMLLSLCLQYCSLLVMLAGAAAIGGGVAFVNNREVTVHYCNIIRTASV